MSAQLTTHPFQRFELERLPSWRGMEFRDEHNAFFEERTRELEAAFQHAIERNALFGFLCVYARVARDMLGRAPDRALFYEILANALPRLIRYFYFLRLRTRPALCVPGSAKLWTIDPALLKSACEVADHMERNNIETQDYDLNADRALKAWFIENVQPILQEYVGFKVGWPWAHIRYANAERHGGSWQYIYRHHPYGYFHFDEVCYSLPIITYLTDVDKDNGAFSYVDGTDKMHQNAILRVFHQALYFHCKICCHEEKDLRAIARLPSVFRGGDLIGHYVDSTCFESHRIVPIVGPVGTTVLFEGHQLLHAGGHPKKGVRKAFFVAFRFPRKKIADFIAQSVEKFWRWQNHTA